MVKDYLLQNWALILVLLAFAISLKITVSLDKKTVRRTYALIAAIFLLSIVVFAEFYLAGIKQHREVRISLMAIRYSATPFIVALVSFTIIKRQRWFVFIPAMLLAIIDIISIWTGIVFWVDDAGNFSRGPVGFLPFLVAGLYCVFLVFLLIRRSNKRLVEIIPILFLCVAFAGGLILPFVFGSDYAHLYCTTIAIALFAYHEFSILMLTKKDSLTGLLNRQAYYAEVDQDPESITAILSIDMNGLKTLNDTQGHAAGDEAILTLGLIFARSLRRKQSAYRIGGDEFVIVCRKCSKEEVKELVERIRKGVAGTGYSCSIGYSVCDVGEKPVDVLLRESDEMMYADKARYYRESGMERRKS